MKFIIILSICGLYIFNSNLYLFSNNQDYQNTPLFKPDSFYLQQAQSNNYLSNTTFNPSKGYIGDEFEFSTLYTHPDNIEPLNITLYLLDAAEDSEIKNILMQKDSIDNNYTNGCPYTRIVMLNVSGAYWYYIRAHYANHTEIDRTDYLKGPFIKEPKPLFSSDELLLIIIIFMFIITIPPIIIMYLKNKKKDNIRSR